MLPVWNLIQTPHAPPARAYAGMTYHQSIGGTVLFGGNGISSQPKSGMLSATWLFDGADVAVEARQA